MCIVYDDWNTDHRRWLKRCLLIRGGNIKKDYNFSHFKWPTTPHSPNFAFKFCIPSLSLSLFLFLFALVRRFEFTNFFHVGSPKEDIFSGHLLSPAFQSSLYITIKNFHLTIWRQLGCVPVCYTIHGNGYPKPCKI